MIWGSCRTIKLSLENGISPDSLFGFLLYSGTVCMQSKSSAVIKEACRVGKAVISLVNRPGFQSTLIVPRANFVYYGLVAIWTESLQLCTINLRKGLDVAMSCGNSETTLYYNSLTFVRCALLGGEHLPSILKETDIHLKAMYGFGNYLSFHWVAAYRETISILIDKGEHTAASNDFNIDINSENQVYVHRYNETLWVNKMLQAFWMGYTTRCHHYASKALELTPAIGNHNRLVILFYSTLNSFRGIKKSKGGGSQFRKMKPLYNEAITYFEQPWNFLLRSTRVIKIC